MTKIREISIVSSRDARCNAQVYASTGVCGFLAHRSAISVVN